MCQYQNADERTTPNTATAATRILLVLVDAESLMQDEPGAIVINDSTDGVTHRLQPQFR
jgi:hypothetical protein